MFVEIDDSGLNLLQFTADLLLLIGGWVGMLIGIHVALLVVEHAISFLKRINEA